MTATVTAGSRDRGVGWLRRDPLARPYRRTRFYDALGIPFPLRDTPVPDPELTARVREQFREHGLRAL
jgi:hypothetical protein